jgi:hypothetical protein
MNNQKLVSICVVIVLTVIVHKFTFAYGQIITITFIANQRPYFAKQSNGSPSTNTTVQTPKMSQNNVTCSNPIVRCDNCPYPIIKCANSTK